MDEQTKPATPVEVPLTEDRAMEVSVLAGSVFQPRTPIAAREFFAGRIKQITTLADAVAQTGLHVVIYGERGVGKTSMANVVKPLIEVFQERSNQTSGRLIVKTIADSVDTFSSLWRKLFDEITWTDNRPSIGLIPDGKKPELLRKAFGLPESLTVNDVRRTLARLSGAVFTIDEFDRAAERCSQEFTDLIKALSDLSINCTVILVGVSDTVDSLIKNHASITRALVQVFLPRMIAPELREILTKAENALTIRFMDDAADLIVQISQGLPHYTHLVGLHAVRRAAGRLSALVTRADVFAALREAVAQAQQSVTNTYSKATHSAHKEALYKHVLLACAVTAARSLDVLGFFNPGTVAKPLSSILNRPVEIAAFNHHLSEFSQAKRGEVLERVGQQRAYRFRFRDPLLVPYIFMDAVNCGLIDDQKLSELLGEDF